MMNDFEFWFENKLYCFVLSIDVFSKFDWNEYLKLEIRYLACGSLFIYQVNRRKRTIRQIMYKNASIHCAKSVFLWSEVTMKWFIFLALVVFGLTSADLDSSNVSAWIQKDSSDVFFFIDFDSLEAFFHSSYNIISFIYGMKTIFLIQNRPLLTVWKTWMRIVCVLYSMN